MLVAITRTVSPAMSHCELTHIAREVIDLERADQQHRQYEMQLVGAGCDIIRLPCEPALPDSVFVEDAAVILDEAAVMTRPGAESRRGEVRSVAGALGTHRPLLYIEAPGTLDGGDVVRAGRTLYVGAGYRSNAEGVAQLRRLLMPYDYRVIAVPFSGCLHLKSAVTWIAEQTLLINSQWVGQSHFEGYECIEVDPSEPAGANALAVNGELVYPRAFPETAQKLERRNFRLRLVDISEFAKAEGGVTCCSLIFGREKDSG